MTKNNLSKGKLLGSQSAETDNEMLNNAFLETQDYYALTTTDDFNFVVGRRGTGKSALFIKVAEYFKNKKHHSLFMQKPKEHETLAFQAILKNHTDDYQITRAITRIIWQAHLLLLLLEDLSKHWKIKNSKHASEILFYKNKYKTLLLDDSCGRCSSILRLYEKKASSIEELPGIIVKELQITSLQKTLKEMLININHKVVFLFDGLDEGWFPNKISAGIIGGLAKTASDFAEQMSGTHIVLFVRDNMFRALASFDLDFTRHIEGNTIRLKWDATSLLHLVANRLRFSLNLKSLENDVKVWNRFTQRELKNQEGFALCLQSTLFRPRDILILLNFAYLYAKTQGQHELIKKDIEISAKQISVTRLTDLLKEYDTVFPGLELFIEIFHSKLAVDVFKNILVSLDNHIKMNTFETKKSMDFAILNTNRKIFQALYSVGFIGVENKSLGNYIFCHDGTQSNLEHMNDTIKTCIHPCYWKALDLNIEVNLEPILIEINDEYNFKKNPESQDYRIKMIGELIADLPKMPLGNEGASIFEQWVLRTVKILFSGTLFNPELHPNASSVQRRDIVAINNGSSLFWKRVLNDYKSRQVIFEIKNYEKLKADDFRQALSYSTNQYGNFVIIVVRSENKGLSNIERGWVKEMWDSHKKLIFILDANSFQQCIKKVRKVSNKYDYTDNLLNKRLDIFERSYLSLKHQTKYKKKKKKK